MRNWLCSAIGNFWTDNARCRTDVVLFEEFLICITVLLIPLLFLLLLLVGKNAGAVGATGALWVGWEVEVGLLWNLSPAGSHRSNSQHSQHCH